VDVKVILILLSFASSWTNLTGKPTTLAGYGITDAVTNTYALRKGYIGISAVGNGNPHPPKVYTLIYTLYTRHVA
jgi:hypothetical protein